MHFYSLSLSASLSFMMMLLPRISWKPWMQTKERQRGRLTAWEHLLHITTFIFLPFQGNVMHWRGWTESMSQANVSCGSNYWRLSESRVWDPLLIEIMKEAEHKAQSLWSFLFRGNMYAFDQAYPINTSLIYSLKLLWSGRFLTWSYIC